MTAFRAGGVGSQARRAPSEAQRADFDRRTPRELLPLPTPAASSGAPRASARRAQQRAGAHRFFEDEVRRTIGGVIALYTGDDLYLASGGWSATESISLAQHAALQRIEAFGAGTRSAAAGSA